MSGAVLLGRIVWSAERALLLRSHGQELWFTRGEGRSLVHLTIGGVIQVTFAELTSLLGRAFLFLALPFPFRRTCVPQVTTVGGLSARISPWGGGTVEVSVDVKSGR